MAGQDRGGQLNCDGVDLSGDLQAKLHYLERYIRVLGESSNLTRQKLYNPALDKENAALNALGGDAGTATKLFTGLLAVGVAGKAFDAAVSGGDPPAPSPGFNYDPFANFHGGPPVDFSPPSGIIESSKANQFDQSIYRSVGAQADRAIDLTSIPPDVAEGQVYNILLNGGDVGIQRSGKVHASGPDSITAEQIDEGSNTWVIHYNDVTMSPDKFQNPSLPSNWSNWQSEGAEAVERFDLSHLNLPADQAQRIEAGIDQALKDGRVDYRPIYYQPDQSGQAVIQIGRFDPDAPIGSGPMNRLLGNEPETGAESGYVDIGREIDPAGSSVDAVTTVLSGAALLAALANFAKDASNLGDNLYDYYSAKQDVEAFQAEMDRLEKEMDDTQRQIDCIRAALRGEKVGSGKQPGPAPAGGGGGQTR